MFTPASKLKITTVDESESAQIASRTVSAKRKKHKQKSGASPIQVKGVDAGDSEGTPLPEMKSARSRVSPELVRRSSISTNNRDVLGTALSKFSPNVRKSLDSNFIKSQDSKGPSSTMGSMKRSSLYESLITENNLTIPSGDYIKTLKVDSNLANIKQESSKRKQFRIYDKL